MNRIDNPENPADSSRLHPLVFEVTFDATLNQLTHDSGLTGRSVVVQVESEGLSEALALTADPAGAARHEAEALACRAALQTIEKDLPAGFEPACLPLWVDQLPAKLQGKAPTLRTGPALAWLVD
jgi:hypothetical protein